MTHAADLEQSWIANAANWTQAVRERLIPSRKAGTDAAIVDAIVARRPRRVLDVGCGEGWLTRRLRLLTACETTGIDFSPDLIRDAAATDAGGRYLVLRYADLIDGRHGLGGDFDVIAFNYALFEEDITPLLNAARSLLAPGGAVVIQTLHPNAFAGERDGWRTEDFTAFQSRNWAPMPWYYRSVASWREAIVQAGLAITETREPKAEPDGPPLSLLLICESAPS
jgi:SAM-dependent methyltransferase